MLFWVIYSVYGIYFKTIPITRDLLLHTTILFSMMIHKANIFHFVLLNFSCRSFLNIFLFCILPLTSGLSASPGNLDLFTKSPQTWEALLIWNFIFYNFFKKFENHLFISVHTRETFWAKMRQVFKSPIPDDINPARGLSAIPGGSQFPEEHTLHLAETHQWLM